MVKLCEIVGIVFETTVKYCAYKNIYQMVVPVWFFSWKKIAVVSLSKFILCTLTFSKNVLLLHDHTLGMTVLCQNNYLTNLEHCTLLWP